MNLIEASKIIAAATMRPFTKDDYFGWDVTPGVPHEIGESGEYTVVRNGDHVELHHHTAEEVIQISLKNC